MDISTLLLKMDTTDTASIMETKKQKSMMNLKLKTQLLQSTTKMVSQSDII